MTVEIEERLATIRLKQQQAQQRKSRAEANRDEATERHKKALKILSEEYGCKTVAAGRKKLASLEAETETALSKIEEKVAGL